MKRPFFLFLALACEPQLSATTATADVCELASGAPFGPCVDGTCERGLFCLPSLKGGSVCTVPCTPSCAPSCAVPDGYACNPSGACTRACEGPEGGPDDGLCEPGQFCAKSGDTAPWECFWPS